MDKWRRNGWREREERQRERQRDGNNRENRGIGRKRQGDRPERKSPRSPETYLGEEPDTEVEGAEKGRQWTVGEKARSRRKEVNRRWKGRDRAAGEDREVKPHGLWPW